MYKRLLTLALIAVAACDSETPVATDQTVAEDSLLAIEVMAAKGDSGIFGPVDDRVYVEDLAAKKAAPKPKPVPPPIIAVPKPKPTLADVSVPLSQMPRSRPEPEPKPTLVGIISPGTALSVVTNERACSRVFRGVLVSSLRGSNGVVIPSGASATGEVISADKWGAGLSVRVRSVHHNGRSYPVISRVQYVLPEEKNGATCIPDRTRIDVKTTEPLRVVASAN